MLILLSKVHIIISFDVNFENLVVYLVDANSLLEKKFSSGLMLRRHKLFPGNYLAAKMQMISKNMYLAVKKIGKKWPNLRRLTMVSWALSSSSTLMGLYYESLSVATTIMISSKCPIIVKQVVVIFMTSHVTIATEKPVKNTLNLHF